MHKDDQMTPVERAKALKNGQAVDRMPIKMLYGAQGPGLLGLSIRQSEENARVRADVQKKTYEVFGIDGLNAKYGLHGMAVAYGAKMMIPENQAPAILEHPLKDLRDVHNLDLEIASITRDPNAKKCYEMAQILLEEMGDEVGCGFGMTGPFTSAYGLVGIEKLLRAMKKEPEQVHDLLEFTLQAAIQISTPFLKMGLPVAVSDPVASGSLLSEKTFREFVLPYSKRFIEACKAVRPYPVGVHICGNTRKLLTSIADCGYDGISLDNAVDLSEAVEVVGDRVALSGNVQPVSVMYGGTVQDVRKAVRSCYRKGYKNPKGFTICTGCDTPKGAPMENSLAYMDEARKCAKYPINPANFEEE